MLHKKALKVFKDFQGFFCSLGRLDNCLTYLLKI